jgi:hypothetical protein
MKHVHFSQGMLSLEELTPPPPPPCCLDNKQFGRLYTEPSLIFYPDNQEDPGQLMCTNI